MVHMVCGLTLDTNYRVTSLVRNTPLLGPYSSIIPKIL